MYRATKLLEKIVRDMERAQHVDERFVSATVHIRQDKEMRMNAFCAVKVERIFAAMEGEE